VDLTSQTADVREIDLRNNDMHSLRGSKAFQISNQTNSFLDESTAMIPRLDQQGKNSWDTRFIGAFQTPKTPVISGKFIATPTENEAMMIGQFPASNQAISDITRLLELKTAIRQACDIVPIQP